MSFYSWLRKQAGRGDAVGDLAAEVALDPDWPRKGLSAQRDYLRRCMVPPEAIKALGAAWQEYKAEREAKRIVEAGEDWLCGSSSGR